jgi:Acyclic terpene utilisation family protein AtuA
MIGFETGAERPPQPRLRVGNCSGFYGDRFSAMQEMLEGGPLDVLTGDYLAELTMLILGRDTMKDASLGYARTFVRQVEDCLGLALERGVRIVSNAGGLNPAGLADKVREVAKGLGLDVAVAHVEGDDVRAVGEWPDALTANAYLGGFGIAVALRGGADVVVTGRVTDASLVVGAGAAEFGWGPTSYDELAGAVVAGHVLECGAQATGGNFSGFRSLPHTGKPLGFPIAELAADGSSVITKHDGTGGAVTVDTVTAQLLYEIQSTRYLGPDVTTLLDTIQLEQEGPDRVAVTGVRGEAPPARLKVAVNELGGYRNTVEFVLTGLDIDAKADWVREQMESAFAASGAAPSSVTWSRTSVPHTDAATEESASCLLRCAVKDPTTEPVGKPFTAAAVELALASYPGFTMTAPPSPPTPYGVYRPAYIDRSAVTHTVVHADGSREVVPDPPETVDGSGPDGTGQRTSPFPAPSDVVTRRLPLGTFVHARSGDKGGDANLGLWVAREGRDEKYDARVTWLSKVVSPHRVRDLVPEAEGLDVEVYLLPNLGAVNVLIRGLLGEGVAASTRFDPQAKGLGEWVRSRMVAIEESLL